MRVGTLRLAVSAAGAYRGLRARAPLPRALGKRNRRLLALDSKALLMALAKHARAAKQRPNRIARLRANVSQ
jgi:hypothetical protein